MPFGFFYMAIARMGPTQTNDRLFNVLLNGIMITNVMNYLFNLFKLNFFLKSFAIGPFSPDTVLSSIIVSSGMLIMNGTLIQNFNLMNQLSSLDSLVVLKAGVCNITYLSATNFSMSRGPMFFSAGVNFLLGYSTFVYFHF